MDTTRAASTTSVYGVGALAPAPEGHYVPREAGMDSVIAALAQDATNKGARLHLAHQVTDVRESEDGMYVLDVRAAFGGKQYRYSKARARVVCAAVPPAAAFHWTLSKQWLMPMLHAVRPKALAHVYAQGDRAPTMSTDSNFRILVGDSPLAQIISGDYVNGKIFQAAYASGQLAQYWLHRWQSAGSEEELCRDVADLLKRDAPSELNVPSIRKVMPCYFSRAIHMWRPARHLDENKSSNHSVLPLAHVGKYGFMWCNEAFNTAQAWIEGALRQANESRHVY
jgi:hypothetical protein